MLDKCSVPHIWDLGAPGLSRLTLAVAVVLHATHCIDYCQLQSLLLRTVLSFS